MSVFKDFPRLENLEKLFQDFQGPARALILNFHLLTPKPNQLILVAKKTNAHHRHHKNNIIKRSLHALMMPYSSGSKTKQLSPYETVVDSSIPVSQRCEVQSRDTETRPNIKNKSNPNELRYCPLI